MKIISGGASDRGMVREKNQDRILFHVNQNKQYIFAIASICDGIGSFENSEIASEIVTQKLDEWFTWAFRQYENGTPEEEIVEELENTVHEANETVFLLAKEKQIQIGCTMSTLMIINENYYILHVGDSRICEFRDGILNQITRDEVSVREINGQVKTRLVNFMGRNMELWLSRINGSFREGDCFILGSDGFFHELEAEDFGALIAKVKNDKHMQQACEKALKLVMSRGERDNVSCIVVQAQKK